MSIRPLHPLRFAAFTLAAGVFLACGTPSVHAEDIQVTVSNGDFETAGNDGTLGGFLPILTSPNLGPTILGSGPWIARSTALLGLLAAPQVTVASNGSANGTCRISGLAGITALGSLLNNRASISQTLSVSAEPQAVYTLEADIDRGSLLTAGVLSQNGVGIALTLNGTVVATSLNGTTPLLTVELLSGSTYHVKVRYTTDDNPPAGFLGIRLFAGEDASLLSAGVLPAVTFDNVKLTVSLLES